VLSYPESLSDAWRGCVKGQGTIGQMNVPQHDGSMDTMCSNPALCLSACPDRRVVGECVLRNETVVHELDPFVQVVSADSATGPLDRWLDPMRAT